MNDYLFQKKTGLFKVIHTTVFILYLLFGFGNAPAYSQGMGMKKHLPMDSKQTLTDQISEIRSKVFRLETVLEKKHQGSPGRTVAGMGPMGTMQPNGMKGGPMRNGPNMTGPPAGMTPGSKMQGMGVNKMGPMGTMQPNGMKGGPMRNRPNMTTPLAGMTPGPKMQGMGMKMMGRMSKNSSALLPSSLPGFPGVSHIYHIGATDFFLDHSDHIRLTVQQKTTLNQNKEKATLDNSTMDRKIQKLEQDLWVLTSSDQPDIKKIDEKIGEIARLKGKMRLAFIQAVGQAARVLTPKQLEKLKGM